MKNKKKKSGKWILSFGVLVILSGVYFLFKSDYVGGISGLLVGGMLVYLNFGEISKKG